MKTVCSRIGLKYQTCLISSYWTESLSEAGKSESVHFTYYTIFLGNLSTPTNQNLQIGSKYLKLASTRPDSQIWANLLCIPGFKLVTVFLEHGGFAE